MTQARPKARMAAAYDPASVESRIYRRWMEGEYFTPAIDESRRPFVIIMPPPNVTGELHMGHALMAAVEDLMVRWRRMRGEPTLYLPGTDHAGIATQVVVERMLAAEGTSRHDLGRERFVERVGEWVERYGNRIHDQLKRLGVSCDWTWLSFTLDQGPSRAVRTTFVNLYKKGLIYRGERITSWCTRCSTALSDLEVDHQEEKGWLYHVRYRAEDGGEGVVVATTRPETLLGDTGVAVHPDDERYAALVGGRVVLPVLGRRLPVVADGAVDPEFGTGALKVTPGHDPSDFEIGQRHGLPIVSVMNLDGTMNGSAGPYEGLDMAECRVKIVEQLEREGLLAGVEPNPHSVGHCGRCSEVVEPIVTAQWYVRMEPLAKPAREAVREGRIRIVPERFAKVYFNWMDGIRDWCVSRQLWWGHRIPVWYCGDCGETIVEMEDPARCPRCPSAKLTQDQDVLDTWFSSGLWPHSTLGWPDGTEDLGYFYPTSVLETGHDILFFWVARMIMMGIENTGEAPFDTVYLHGLITDYHGAKMSKSKGNVLDPLDLIEVYGADALRFALTTGSSPGNDMRLSDQRLEGSRNFANKLWNAARFVVSNLEDAEGLEGWERPRPVHRHDRWIVSRFNRVAGEVETRMEEYQFGEAQRAVYDFLWNEFCDWYIEMSKIRMRSDGGSAESPCPVLAYVLEGVLRLLHPFMPFVTEEIWSTLTEALPRREEQAEALIVARYPQADPSLVDDEAETEVAAVIDVVRAVRNLRAEFRLPAGKSVPAAVDAPGMAPVIEAEASTISALARAELSLGAVDGAGSNDRVSAVLPIGTVTVPLGGLVDLDRERSRLSGELGELEAHRARLSARLANESFVSKAPEDVVERERERLARTEERRERVQEILSRLGG